MEADKIFKDVINYIENSRLNFSLSRTPFSASISLKRSFVKHNLIDPNPVPASRTEVEVNELNKQVLNLTSRLQNLDNDCKALEADKLKVEMLYQKESDKNKAASEAEGQFRLELLKLKSEKNILIGDTKNVQVSLAGKDKEIASLRSKLKEKEEKSKVKLEKLENFESKVKELMKDKETANMMIENLESHLRVSKEERKPREVCHLCESRFELKSDLKVHVRTQHQRCKASQCDEGLVPNQPSKETIVVNKVETPTVFPYKCFYREKPIKCEEHLEDHRKMCHEVKNCL